MRHLLPRLVCTSCLVLLTISATSAMDGPSFVEPTNRIERAESMPADEGPFDGLWSTRYGRLRLATIDDQVIGVYDSPVGVSKIEGEVNEGKLEFTYHEPNVSGEGWFELAEDGASFNGRWREDGSENWFDWDGRRMTVPDGTVWLMVLEANWEENLSDREFAFGDMLETYFQMSEAMHVQFRHRYFNDEEDLKRFLVDVQFIPGPVCLLISTHGTPQGIVASDGVIAADVFNESLIVPSNIRLLHLSGCSMMLSDYPSTIHEQMGDRAMFPISGYKTNVNWHTSALSDFTFLSLLLIRGQEPRDAVENAILVSPYIGDEASSDSVFRPLGLSILDAPGD